MIALAVSGGVDSMAMAHLASCLQRAEPDSFRFHALVVDHCSRRKSSAEAYATRDRLQHMGIDTAVARLNWDRPPSSFPNFESIARDRRYAELGYAASKNRSCAILTAHHGDDQAETILLRLIAGYTAGGLRGIQEMSNLPVLTPRMHIHNTLPDESELESFSGSRMRVAGSGIKLLRPLVDFTKQDLIDTCRAGRIGWFDDATNLDATLTPRNAIRTMFSDQAKIPQSLRPQRLLELGFHVNMRRQAQDARASELLTSEGAVSGLDLWSGICTFDVSRLHPGVNGDWMSMPLSEQHSLSVAIKRLVEFVSPSWEIATDTAMRICRMLWDTKQSNFNAGSVFFERDTASPSSRTRWGASREPLTDQKRRELDSPIVQEAGFWSRYTLFDGRWWIRARSDTKPPTRLRVRPFQSSDINDIRHRPEKAHASDIEAIPRALDHHAPGKIRSTLPVVANDNDVVLAFPTLNLTTVAGKQAALRFGCCYKSFDIPSAVPRVLDHRSLGRSAKPVVGVAKGKARPGARIRAVKSTAKVHVHA